jgi:hypothetical protein
MSEYFMIRRNYFAIIAWTPTYLALGRGTGGVLGACFIGLWSAGVDMLRFWVPTLD